MNEVDILKSIIEYLECGDLKNSYIHEQQYENATSTRDIERNMARDLYIKIYNEDTNKDTSKTFKWSEYEVGIQRYFSDKYSIDVHPISDPTVTRVEKSNKSIIREIKLIILGI